VYPKPTNKTSIENPRLKMYKDLFLYEFLYHKNNLQLGAIKEPLSDKTHIVGFDSVGSLNGQEIYLSSSLTKSQKVMLGDHIEKPTSIFKYNKNSKLIYNLAQKYSKTNSVSVKCNDAEASHNYRSNILISRLTTQEEINSIE
jgi:hypothetical protein